MLYKCNSCDYYSNRKFNLQIHVQRKHANENVTNSNIILSNSSQDSDVIMSNLSQDSMSNSSQDSNEDHKFAQPHTITVSKGIFCQICGTVFKNRQAKYRHRLKGMCKPTITVCEEVFKSNDPSDSEEEINKLKDQIEKLKRRMRGFTETDKKKIAAGQNWKCNICKVSLPYDYHVDHIMPIHAGGLNERSNGQALCVECHKEKTFREKK